MRIEITPEDSRLLCELLSAHRARTISSLEMFSNSNNNSLSERRKEALDKHISFINNNLTQIDNLFSAIKGVNVI